MEALNAAIKDLPQDLTSWIIESSRDPVFMFYRANNKLAKYNQAAFDHLKAKIWIQEKADSIDSDVSVPYENSECQFIRYQLADNKNRFEIRHVSQDRINNSINAWEMDKSNGVSVSNFRRRIYSVLEAPPEIEGGASLPTPWIEPVACNKDFYIMGLYGAPIAASQRFQRHLQGYLRNHENSISEKLVDAAIAILDSWVMHNFNLQIWCQHFLKKIPVAKNGQNLQFEDYTEGSASSLWTEWTKRFCKQNSNVCDANKILDVWSEALRAKTKDGTNARQLVWKTMLLSVPGE